MGKIDEVKSRIAWLETLFKITVMVLVADVAGVVKLSLDGIDTPWFYAGIALATVLTVAIIVLSRKIETHIRELKDI
jgi:hypothetical protein